MAEDRRYGVEAGAVFPAAEARRLLNPLRRLLHPPGVLARRTGAPADGTVVELGCGPGWYSPALAARVSAGRLVLADLQPAMVAMARARVAASTARRQTSAAAEVRGLVTDAADVPLPAGTADAVVLATVLGETPDPAAVLREAHRLLRPRGRVVVVESRTDPDAVALSRLRALAAGAGLEVARAHRRLTGYTALLEPLG
jgi:ubiquinone/menaquinone biosynthesis C-methylase UbiE